MDVLIIRICFGLVVLAMAFLVYVFGRAYRDPFMRLDRRYKIVCGALAIGSAGVLMWAFNPLLKAFGGPPLPPYGMAVASSLILIAACSLIGSTAIGGNPRLLIFFLLCATAWAVGCIIGSLT